MDESLADIQKKYCSRAITLAIFVAFVFILFDYKDMAKGLILGSLFSIINFVLMGESIPKKLGYSRKRTMAMSFSGIFLRYMLMSIPLIIGLKYAVVNFFATGCGLFSVQIVILTDHIFKFDDK